MSEAELRGGGGGGGSVAGVNEGGSKGGLLSSN